MLKPKKTRQPHIAKALSALATLILIAACSSSEVKGPDTAEGIYEKAQQYEKDETYHLAIEKYTEIKNKFPYSKFAVQSELAIADLHFKDESWPEAQAAYQIFKELHPKHEKMAYVTFRLGLSIYKQIPDSIDRDLSLSQSALQAFDDVRTKYSSSAHVKEAKELSETINKMLAEKEIYIADFYFRKKEWLAALGRYEGVLNKHQNLGFDAKALSRASICANLLGDNTKANSLTGRLKKDFPGSKELQEALAESKL